MKNEMRIYVANLGAYNAGELIGEWIDLPCSEEELQERIDEILAAEDEDGEVYGEEVAIHDYELPFKVSEYSNMNQINEWCQVIADSDADEEIIEAILENYYHVEEALQVLESGDYRVYYNCDSMEDVAYEVIEGSGMLDKVPDTLKNYFDYQSFGRDLRYEGTFLAAGRHYVEIIG